ncbi:hypothetical protein PG985_000141 [Apiospora marii]|uniref:uncharacterized protein n=1 Tax=Apiospora marii TaxID=335849 RepID=UPI00312EAE8E
MQKSDLPGGGEATPPEDAPKDAPKESTSAPAATPPLKSPKRKRSEDDTEGGDNKKKAQKPQQDPPKRKRAAEEGDKADKPSKRSKPAPEPKSQGKKKKPTAKAATGANSTPVKARGAAKEKKTPPPPAPAKKKADKEKEKDEDDDGKIDQNKVKSAPKLSTSAANSNWRNRDPEEKLGDAKIPARDQAMRRLNRVKKTLELRFRDLNKLCFDLYEKAFLDKDKGEDRRDPEIVKHLDLVEGLFARRDNEREDLRRRIMAFKDPQTWDEAEKVLRRRKSKKQQKEEESEPDERVQGLVEVLRSIPVLEEHVDKCEARVKRDAKRVRDDIALEKKGLREVETRVYEVPLDRFAAKTLESVNKSIRKEDIEDAKEVLERNEAPDEGPSGEEEEEKSDDSGDKSKYDGQESEESAEYIQL